MIRLLLTTLLLNAGAESCRRLFDSSLTEDARVRGRQLLYAAVEPAREVAYVGVARSELRGLLNGEKLPLSPDGKISLIPWFVSDRPALLSHLRRHPLARIPSAPMMAQFNRARDQGWARSVLEASGREPTPADVERLVRYRAMLESESITPREVRHEMNLSEEIPEEAGAILALGRTILPKISAESGGPSLTGEIELSDVVHLTIFEANDVDAFDRR